MKAIPHERTAVVDAYLGGGAGGEVGDPYDGVERQRLVGRGVGVHVVELAVGGGTAVKVGAVPGGSALLRLPVAGGDGDGRLLGGGYPGPRHAAIVPAKIASVSARILPMSFLPRCRLG